MDNRKYNVYFNTHTISGIIICGILYVIFFAGSFSFFKNDIAAWQKNDSNYHTTAVKRDFNYVIDSLAGKHKLKGRDFDFTLQRHTASAYVAMSASHDTTVKKKKAAAPPEGKPKGRGRRGDGDNAFFTYDFSKKAEADYTTSYTMGEFLYRLHFLAQLNQVFPFRIGVPFGYLLAGIVSFIFLFALITGLLLHWDKLVSNFFTFRPWNKWKSVWTDLHTVLGVIGFPYQLVFALTGIILIFNSFLIVPYTKLFYKGQEEKIYKDLGFGVKSDFKYTYNPLDTTKTYDVNALVTATANKWQRSDITLVAIRNYGDANMYVVIQGKPQTNAQMNGVGELICRVRDQKIIAERAPLAPAGYNATITGILYHLHFGDFGGRPLRVMYFVLGIMGCIVINSGVMIWLVARDKKNIPERKRKFNFWTANVYLASSLSLLPVTGVTMIALLFLDNPGQPDIYHWFFYSWLALSVYFLALRSLDRINRQSTLLSAVICLALPVLDGIFRGNWFWITYNRGAFDILFIDALFLALSVISAIVLWKINTKPSIEEKVSAKTKTKTKTKTKKRELAVVE
jgi:uncharacterized iron-regulated membrane protein